MDGTPRAIHEDPPSVVVRMRPWPVRGELITVEVVPTTAESNPGTPGRVVVVVVGRQRGGRRGRWWHPGRVPWSPCRPGPSPRAARSVVPNGSDPADLAGMEQVNPFNIPVPGGTVTATHVAPSPSCRRPSRRRCRRRAWSPRSPSNVRRRHRRRRSHRPRRAARAPPSAMFVRLGDEGRGTCGGARDGQAPAAGRAGHRGDVGGAGDGWRTAPYLPAVDGREAGPFHADRSRRLPDGDAVGDVTARDRRQVTDRVGMPSIAQVAPPSWVTRMAAPRAFPPPPSVAPVAQQDVAVGQLTDVTALTGNGRSTELNEPAHGVEVAMRPTGGAESWWTMELQAVVASTTTSPTGTRSRPGRDAGTTLPKTVAVTPRCRHQSTP